MKALNEVEKFDLDLFLETISYYSAEPIAPGGYSNSDMQKYIYPGIFSIRIWDYEDGEEKEWHVKRPATLDEALNIFLPGAFPGSEYTDEEKEEISEEYYQKLNREIPRDEFYCFPRIGLRRI